MRTLSILFAATAAVTAQSPLTTTFASNNGQSGNMFDLRPISAPIIVDDFDINCDAGTWDVEVYTLAAGGSHVGQEQNPGAWTLVASIPGVVSAGANVPTPLGQQLNINCPPGVNTGIYVTLSNGTGINYTTGTGYVVGDVYASDANLEFLAGTGNVYPFGAVFGPPSSTRVWNGNIYYTVASGNFPSVSSFGAGCGGGSFASIYEQMSSANMDLDGYKIDALNTGSGYLFMTVPGAGNIAPGANATIMPLGDDDSQDSASVGGTLGLWVGSNCWIALGGGNSNGFAPNVSTMLSNPAAAIYAWTDLRPLQASGSGLGDIYYEEAAGVATVTYLGVEGWNTGLPNTIQFIYDSNTGNFSIEFENLNFTNPEDWLIGYSTAGASLDPGATDLSSLVAAPAITAAADTSDLALSSNVAGLGASWDLTTDNIDVASPIAITYLGDRAPTAIPFSAIGLQAPGCDINLATAIFGLAGVSTGGSTTVSLSIPNNPALAGALLSAQSLSLTLSNAANILSSNGLELQVY
jgi:hypothetical protein